MTERTRTINCKGCGHRYVVTRVSTIEDKTILIEDETPLGKAYCPSCGTRAKVLQRGVDDADGS